MPEPSGDVAVLRHRESAPARLAPSELALPAALAGLTIYFGFNAGGYFADATGWVTAGLSVALGLCALAVGRPPRGLTWPLAWAAGSLALFGVWTLLSASWSHAPSRALLEFDRVLLYLGVLVVFGTVRAPERALRRLPAAFVLAAVVLCGAALFARVLPTHWPFALPPPSSRMNWPLTYENAMGMLAALGMVFGLHVASWRREHPATRILAAASLPLLAAALILTFSRGGTLAAVVGVLAYLMLCRSRGAVTALVAAGPFVYVAARGAFDADKLQSTHLTAPAAVNQGEALATTIVVAMALAGLAMALLLTLERRLTLLPAWTPRLRRRGLRAAVLVGAAVALGGAALASGAPGDVYRKVIENKGGSGPGGVRQRLAQPLAVVRNAGNRPKYWHVSLHSFSRHELSGTGAGTFGIRWARERPVPESTTEGHSIYTETLGELGLVGGVLLLLALGAVIWPSVARLRTARRPLYAGVLAASIAWLLHAGIDWDWEMPVLTVWLFAAGGCALAASSKRVVPGGRPRWRWRALVVGLCSLAAITPAAIGLSQNRLDRSVKAFEAGNCRAADSDARAAISAIGSRPEPYSIVAYCEARAGRLASARTWMLAARSRDPHAWQYVYGLAVIRAAGGGDPRPGLRAARALDPLEGFLIYAQRKIFTGTRPRAWRHDAANAQVPLVRSSGASTGGR